MTGQFTGSTLMIFASTPPSITRKISWLEGGDGLPCRVRDAGEKLKLLLRTPHHGRTRTAPVPLLREASTACLTSVQSAVVAGGRDGDETFARAVRFSHITMRMAEAVHRSRRRHCHIRRRSPDKVCGE